MAPADTTPAVELGGICLDCSPEQFEAVVAFYVTVLGADEVHHEQRWASLRDPRGTFLNIQAQEWYEPPVWPERVAEQTKMMHFECGVRDMHRAVAAVTAAGGTVAAEQPHDRDPGALLVVLDPAGHPFCLIAD